MDFLSMEPSPRLPQYNGISSTLSSNLSSSSSSELNMPGLITPSPPHTTRLEYDGYSNFASFLRKKLQTTRYEVVEFSGVSKKELDFILSDENRPARSPKFSYDFRTRVLTVKMRGPAHELMVALFKDMIDQQRFKMGVSGESIPVGSPMTVLGCWAKEPDGSWGPSSTGDLTVVLEAGVSESASRLATDAKGWLESPGSSVQACITIDLSTANDITVGIWRLRRRRYGISTRNNPLLATRERHIRILNRDTGPEIEGWTINENMDAVPTDEIRLRLEMFLGRPTEAEDEPDLVIHRDLLIAFATRFWSLQSRHLQA